MSNLIIVTGFFGAPICETAQMLAEEKAFAYLSLDEEIERRDGRSITRLVMMNGEHGYRNQEYEILNEINEDAARDKGLVIACGDGVLYDEMSRDIALANKLIIVGNADHRDELWNRAKADTRTYHAFMHFGTEEEKRHAFDNYIDRQQRLFEETKSMK